MPNLHMRLNNEERLDIGDCLIFLESFNGIPISRNEQWLSSVFARGGIITFTFV